MTAKKYKNNDTFEFRGLIYRYDSNYGEWRLKYATRMPAFVPDTIMECQGQRVGSTVYRLRGYEAPTPWGALKKWLKSVISQQKHKVKENLRSLSESQKELIFYQSPRWSKPQKRAKRR